LEDKESEGAPKRFEDEDLEAILDDDPYQSETQLAEAINVTQQYISKKFYIELEWFKRKIICCHII